MDIRKFAEAAGPLGALGIVVTQDGQELEKYTWDEECRRNIYSASKSFTSCAVGMAVSEGLLSLDEKLTDVFVGELPKNVGENLAKATVRDLLTMHLGQSKAALMGAQRPLYKEENWVKMVLAMPFDQEPGSQFVYNNVGPYLAGILVQRRAGCDLTEYLMPRLFGPLGIWRPTWECDPLGNTFGAGGLMLTLSELHRFGLLYLNEGMWNGQQLIPREWVKESTQQQYSAPYAYLFWRGKFNSFRADGKYGQLSIVFPEKNAVITMTAQAFDVKPLMTLIYDELYPQL